MKTNFRHKFYWNDTRVSKREYESLLKSLLENPRFTLDRIVDYSDNGHQYVDNVFVAKNGEVEKLTMELL